jgi:transposase InsO family protein
MTSISQGVSTTALAAALDQSRQAVLSRAKKERWAYRETGSGRLWAVSSLPQDVMARIAPDVGGRSEITAGTAAVFKETSEANREKARYRMAVLSIYASSGLRIEDFVSAFNAGLVNRILLDKMGTISIPTLYRWNKMWREEGTDGIVPRWGMTAQAGTSMSLIERGYLEHWYLGPEKRSARHCYNLLRHNLPDSQASYQTALRYLKSLPEPLVAFHRLGRTKFDSLCQPYIEREPTLYAPMQQVVSDHHCFDFVVIKDGKLFRPWITVFQDFRTAKLVGWCPSVYPSSLSIMIAFYRMVNEFGTAELIHIDNGKDYRSKILNGSSGKIKIINECGIEEESLIHVHGAFSLLGCEVTFSKPYHGQSKGRMERTFGSMAEYFSKETGSYVGSNTVTRPEDAQLFYRALNKKAKRRDVYRWEDFVRGFEAFVGFWNANWRGAGKGLDGMTPDEAFAAYAKPMRTVDPETLALALTRPEVRKVRENGVTVAGVEYWAPELFEYSGREVIVRVPLGNPDRVVVMDPKGKLICSAVANWFLETGDLAADNKRVNSARKANLEAVKRFGVGRVTPPEGKRTFIEIAESQFLAGKSPLDFPLPLPLEEPVAMAAGAERDSAPAGLSQIINPLDM